MHSLSRYVIVIALLPISNVSLAALPPPSIPFPPHAQKATLLSMPAKELMMGSLPIKLEETSLDELRTAASTGLIEHQGDAGESMYWLCYTNLNSSPAERIWVLSDGEMGGNKHRITGVSAHRLPGAQATADCPALPAKLTPLKLDTGIWLNASSQAARARLGMFSFKSGNWEAYEYIGKAPGKCGSDGFDLTTSLMLQVVQGKVHSLRISSTTSC